MFYLDHPDGELTKEQKKDLLIESAMQLVPYGVGGSLATLYFGNKQAKQFNRIERFYSELAEKVNQLTNEFPPLNEREQEELIDLIDGINDKVERETSERKRKYFQNFLLHSLSSPRVQTFDTKKFFLDTLGVCNELDLELLARFGTSPNEFTRIREIEAPGVEQYAIIGSIGRLKNFGFIFATTPGMSFGGNTDNSLSDNVKISPFGQKFIEYCLKE